MVTNNDNKRIRTRMVTGWRVCRDYYRLSKVTKKYHFPLPFIDQMPDWLARKECHSLLNNYSSYNQITIAPKD